jgi:hypothetical protein
MGAGVRAAPSPAAKAGQGVLELGPGAPGVRVG